MIGLITCLFVTPIRIAAPGMNKSTNIHTREATAIHVFIGILKKKNGGGKPIGTRPKKKGTRILKSIF
jgi:hypothetical protein